jgi:hypothetical protein
MRKVSMKVLNDDLTIAPLSKTWERAWNRVFVFDYAISREASLFYATIENA